MARTPFLLAVLTAMAPPAAAFSAAPKTVVVTGAGGQTGKALFRRLLSDDAFSPIGVVRTQESKDALLADPAVPIDDADAKIVVCDITDVDAVAAALEWDGVDALCVCTSGTPRPTGEERDGRPVFGYPPGGDPEVVDWLGQKAQIDALCAATSSKPRHVVVCSSMGGTDPSNMLNSIGRTTDPESGAERGGNILLWKRKAEKYLIETADGDPNLSYTIVHPGGLINEPGGVRELIVGVDDDRVTYGGEGSPRTVPREDVAAVMAEACRAPEVYGGRSFDLRAREPAGEGARATSDFARLLDPLEGKNCDYSLGKTM